MSDVTSSANIMDDYLKITKEYEEKYGENTILMMQVGAFYEVYGLKNIETNEIIGSKIVEFIQICQLNIADKKLIYKGFQVLMAGVRDYSLEKYIKLMINAGYTVVIFSQEDDEVKKNKKKRVLQGVYSSGSFISYDTDVSPQMSNNTVCIWLELYSPMRKHSGIGSNNKNIIYGASVINTFTGKSSLIEYEVPFIMNPTTFDELERFITSYPPSELLFLSPFDEKINQQIKQFIGVNCKTVHDISTNNTNEIVTNCSTQTYIHHILSKFFGEDSYNVCSEFNNNIIATQSFCYLLHFLQEHNTNLIRNISIPGFNTAGNRMVLANHTLKQLNIIDDNSNDNWHISKKLTSVLSFLNKCCTSMGSRQFSAQLLNPTTNEGWLNTEYEMTELLLDNEHNHFVDLCRKELVKLRDMEKICRQIVMRRIYPSTLYYLADAVKIIKQLNTCFHELPILVDYLCKEITFSNSSDKSPYEYIDTTCEEFLKYMNKMFLLEKCKSQTSIHQFDENIIQPGVSEPLDRKIAEYTEKIQIFHHVRNHLNKVMGGDADKEYIKIHDTEKSGMSLQITKVRGENLKKLIKDIVDKNSPNKQISIKLTTASFECCLSDIKFSTANSNTYDIDIPILNKLCKDLLYHKDQITSLILYVYNDIIETLDKEWFQQIENIAKYAIRLDILQCKSYLAKTYHYCRPKISIHESSKKSFVVAKQLRHCLIEQLLRNEIYEPNDVSLGLDETDGILLYGTNAVGKTSIIRALGISIIMAQSGIFVPCSEFIYCPYHSIFTRILGNDNLFKGLSTFAVEMSELRIILKMANENSLILGDELCSGTETESALSIFVTGIMELHEKQSSFIFATHFHEILGYDEIQNLKKLSINHMSVLYDKEKDALIYDRKLKSGSGIRTYGLEVCKSLYLESSFLEKAYSIRNKYFPETRGEMEMKTTRYNAKKIRGMCELCKNELSEEVHHLQPQQLADKNGFIGTFHKNHVANLLAVCEKCHLLVHKNPTDDHTKKVPTRRKKTTDGYTVC
uniref:DNA mismatch repair proteins mutS family domain-containing protein n=1 Tax=viral metagenome TaxID=1070528 RepID=A0A6C0DPQ2_9ZZZZ